MSDNTTKLTYGEYFNVSKCPCLSNYIPASKVEEVPCIWYPYGPCEKKEDEEEKKELVDVFEFKSNEKFKPADYSSDICACLSKEEIERQKHIGTIYDCIITIRVFGEMLLDENEFINLGLIVQKFRDTHEICLIGKESLDLSWYNETYDYDFSVIRYKDEYEENPYMDSRFYNCFIEDYDYILRVDLNCQINGSVEELTSFIELK